MLPAAGTIAAFLVGCVLVPVCVVAALVMLRRDGQGWRRQGPPR